MGLSSIIVYKSSEDIPFELRRKFASLAGLVEIADREFETLRQDEIKVREEIHNTIKKDNISIPVNLESLRFYLQKYHKEKKVSPQRLSKLNKFIQNKNISTIEELNNFLSKTVMAKASQETKKLMSSCHSVDRCLLKYFLALGYHFGLNRKELGEIARCPLLLDPKNFKKRMYYPPIDIEKSKDK